MHLPVQPPVKPMLAKAGSTMPDPADFAAGLAFEPKWDGFRCLVFRDGDEIELGSRTTKPMGRYFPEVLAALTEQIPSRCVLDGEIVVAVDGRLSFPLLQNRLHPAKSRVDMLAATQPADFIAFDLLALDDESFMQEPFARRRATLERVLADVHPPIHLTPITHDPALAQHWFDVVEGAGLDGVVAKPLDAPYRPDVRTMIKVKHARTADVVVAGYRLHKASTPERPLLGSLLLRLYDEAGTLQHIGVAASFPMTRRAELHDQLQPLVADVAEHPWGGWAAAEAGDRRPGAASRWNADKDLSFVALRPDLVAEVAYDAMEGTRFRHTAQLRRWRADRDPRSCTYEQLERPISVPLEAVLDGMVGAEQDGASSPTEERP
jgi:ATP-dependent DNA ligase